MRASGRWIILFVVSLLAACRATAGGIDVEHVTPGAGGTGPRILAVVAHPDDEIAFGGTLYKTATALDGVCDVVVITNGEGGFKYATLAERIYELELTDEAIGRRHLPEIRRRELVAGCRILGVHDVYFLGEQDHRYTQDIGEVLGGDADVWDLEHVRAALRTLLDRNDYDFVLTLPPTPSTHAHHKAATLLALEAVAGIPVDRRPVAMCTRPRSDEAVLEEPLVGFPTTRTLAGSDELVFDRTQHFGYRERLSYAIVVNWAIAEHKSQGTMQLLMNAGDEERYLLFAGHPDAHERARALFEALARPQFETKTYGASAGAR